MRNISVGLAGYGRFGKLHAAVLGSLSQATIAAVFDPDDGAFVDAAESIQNAKRYQTFEDLLAHPGLDCLFLVTPEDTHESLAVKAIERGLPIFLEKPLALSAAKGAEIAAMAAEKSVYLQIGFVLRFDGRCSYLRDEIRSGAFGRLATIRGKQNCSRSWFDVYGDRAHAVYETIIHDIDYLVWIVDSPAASVYAMEQYFSGRTYPDACVAMVRFVNGVIAVLETSWLVPDQAPANVLTETWFGTIDSEIEVVGEKRSARLRILESGLEIWTDEATQHPDFGYWPMVNGVVSGALRAQDEHFLEVVASGKPSSITSVADAVEGLRIAEAIVESARSGREVRLA